MTELDKYKKALDLAADFCKTVDGLCPVRYGMKESCKKIPFECGVDTDETEVCWRDYFLREAEKKDD